MSNPPQMHSPSSFSSRPRRSLLKRQASQQNTSTGSETPPFSKLLGSRLGSPFLTTFDLPAVGPSGVDLDVVDGSLVTVPPSFAVTRPSTPGIDFANMSSPTPNCTLFPPSTGKSPRGTSPRSAKGIFPRIWDALSSPGKKNKGKARAFLPYDDIFPLDGEEGELIEDEACFVDFLDSTGTDILARLPPELSVYLLCFLNLSSVIACLSVSKTWRAFAEDNAVWREVFYGQRGWNVDLTRIKPVHHNIYRAIPRLSITSRMSNTVSTSKNPAPLGPDWKALYKTRLELDNRWGTGDAKVTKISGHTDSVYCLEFDSKRIITGSRDRTVKVWNIETGKLIASYRDHEGSVLCLKFDKDWDIIDPSAHGFMVTGSSDYSVRVWELSVGGARAEVKAILNGHTGGVLDLRIDHEFIVSCSKDTLIRVWRRDTCSLHATLVGHQGPVNAVGLQGGRVVSASGDGKMMMWDIKTGKNLRTFEGHDRGLACIEFKDDLIVSGSNDCKIKVWSASKGECLRTLTGHDLLVRALSFDPASGRLVSASYDATVKVWDLHTGKMISDFRNSHSSHIFDVKFDVRRIVSTSHDQQIVVLDFSAGLETGMFV